MLHEKVGGAAALGDDHRPSDVEIAHLMEEGGIRHQAVAVAEGGRPLQGREEVGWMVQAEVAADWLTERS